MPRKESKCWAKSYGSYGATVRVAEREPGGVLYAFYVDQEGVQQKRSLGHRDRKEAVATARKISAVLAARRQGLLDVGIPVSAAPQSSAGGTQVPEPAQQLTLRDGIELAWRGPNRIYPVESRHTRESYRLLQRALEILGPDMTWPELRPVAVSRLIRTLAESRRDGRGARTAEYMCDVLYKTASHLRDSDLIPQDAARPASMWKAKLKMDWERLTRRPVRVARLRHTTEEMGQLFQALPGADPRLRLLLELAAELRGGQAAQARRSDLDLGPTGGFRMGRFTVPGSGRKTGEIVDLHPELREYVEEVLRDGYLSEVEAAYRRKEIPDYFLFPAGEMRSGIASIEQCTWRPADPKTLRDWFERLEQLAGVPHVKGRSLYGLRRQATDLAPEFELDGRVLNRLSGHLHSSTREEIYQDQMTEGLRAKAAIARRMMRMHLKQMGRSDE